MAFTVSQLCQWTRGKLANADRLGDRWQALEVSRLAPLGGSQSHECAFFFSKEYQNEILNAGCGVLVTAQPFFQGMLAHGLPLLDRAAVIVCDDPYWAMAVLSQKFAERGSTVAHVPGLGEGASIKSVGVHPTAVVDPSAELGDGAVVGAHCVVEAGARIGARTRLYPGCYLGPSAHVGDDCVLFPNVVLYEWVHVGNRVRIHANTTLGADGFGYAPVKGKTEGTSTGEAVVGHQKIYHLGRVIVGDDVELGACVTVDRGTLADTRIDRMAKLDNQVHVAHNCHVEEGAILCGGTCLAGGAQVGKFAYVGGLTGVTNRVKIGDAAQVGALSLVTKDVEPGKTAVGNPQREYKEHFRAHAALNRLLAERKKQS